MCVLWKATEAVHICCRCGFHCYTEPHRLR
jgi:hypothetical protein